MNTTASLHETRDHIRWAHDQLNESLRYDHKLKGDRKAAIREIVDSLSLIRLDVDDQIKKGRVE